MVARDVSLLIFSGVIAIIVMVMGAKTEQRAIFITLGCLGLGLSVVQWFASKEVEVDAMNTIREARLDAQDARKETRLARKEAAGYQERYIQILEKRSGEIKGAISKVGVPPKAAVKLDFEAPSEPSFSIHAGSTVTVTGPKYQISIWNLDSPTPELVMALRPYESKVLEKDFITHPDRIGPIALLLDKSRVKDGDRLFGSVVVGCANCEKSENYIFHSQYMKDGWYYENATPVDRDLVIKSLPVVSANDSLFDIMFPLAGRKNFGN